MGHINCSRPSLKPLPLCFDDITHLFFWFKNWQEGSLKTASKNCKYLVRDFSINYKKN